MKVMKTAGKGEYRTWTPESLLQACFPKPRLTIENAHKLAKRKKLPKSFRSSMAASARMTGESLGTGHSHIGPSRMAVAETCRNAMLQWIRSRQKSEYKICGIALDETETEVLSAQVGSKKQRNVESLMMFHTSWFDRAGDTPSQFEVPSAPAILKDTTGQTLQAAVADRIPLGFPGFAATSKFFTVLALISDAAKACVKLGNDLSAQVVGMNPAILLFHMVCLMHQINLVVQAYILPLKILSPLFCGSIFMQKGTNIAALRRAVKGAIFRPARSCLN